MSATAVVEFPVVSKERGQKIQRRRLAIGIPSANRWAKDIGLDRETLTRAEAGTASARTYARIEAWLDNMEEELGMPDSQNTSPSEDVIEYHVSGQGVDLVVRGPVANLDDLEASVSRLLDRLREDGQGRGSA